MISEKLRKKITFLLFLLITAMTLFFFLHIHPTVIISGDDWGNLTTNRKPFPEWGIANPIKVMPEMGYPLFAKLSTLLIMPLGFGFLQSFSIMTAVLTSLLLTIFLHQLLLLLRDNFQQNYFRCLILVILAYLTIFFLFNERGNYQSLYMLWEVNITCFYHYIAPALINSALALYIIRNNENLSVDNFKKNGYLFSLVILSFSYISIFSSLFANVILAVVCGVCILFFLIESKCSINLILKKFPLHIAILSMWLLSVVFEANGGRASSLGNGRLDIEGSINIFGKLISQVQPGYLYIASALIVYGALISAYYFIAKKNTDKARAFSIILISGLLTFVALILLCSRAGSYYAARPVVMWGVFLFVLICSLIAIDTFPRRNTLLSNILLTILVCFLAYSNIAKDSKLQESINLNLTYQQGLEVSQYIIDQVVEADKKKQSSLVLLVPKGDDHDNWPFPVYEGPFISKALKKYNLIENEIHLEVRPDASLNKKMSVPLN